MDTAAGFSIWLIPQRRDLLYFQNNIDYLAEVLGGPVFRPHVTLLGQLENIEVSRLSDTIGLLAGNSGILRGRADTLDFSGDFFQSITLRIAYCPEIFALRNQLCKSLSVRGLRKAYQPHLSLHYGHSQASLKKRAVRQLNIPLQLTFHLDAVEVVKTDGPVNEWASLGSFPFGG